jgi:hypothetical protein
MNVDPDDRRVRLGFDVLTLPEGTGGAGHALRTVVLDGVSRLVGSLRLGRWDQLDAEVVALSVEELSEAVRSFGATPLYGWEFFDTPDESWRRWAGRLSLDVRWSAVDARHTLRLFKEARQHGEDRHLDLPAWFTTVSVYDADEHEVSLDDFAAGGKRWWDAMYSGDPRTKSSGIVPAGKRTEEGA